MKTPSTVLEVVVETALKLDDSFTVGDVKLVLKTYNRKLEEYPNTNWSVVVEQILKSKQTKEWKQNKRSQSISEITETLSFLKEQN